MSLGTVFILWLLILDLDHIIVLTNPLSEEKGLAENKFSSLKQLPQFCVLTTCLIADYSPYHLGAIHILI